MSETRKVLLVTHTRRAEALSAALETCNKLIAAGIIPVMLPADHVELLAFLSDSGQSAVLPQEIEFLDRDCSLSELEVAMVLGGDGTILKAAEIVRSAEVPLVGINLGHVGFLAESERDGLAEAVERVVAKDYVVKERMALDVKVIVDGVEVYRTWALNEATVEKSERMLEVIVEVEEHPLSSFGCDGIVIATPTGSTAYAFSAGGPVVWPSVEALLMVPLSAHALFARPLVIKPDAMVAVEVLQRSSGPGVLWCDGRRTWPLPAGARVEVVKSDKPVLLARLRNSTFTDRLVKKFSLPVAGWRGLDEAHKAE
ncbi:MAG: NAD kinase [Rhodoluna sp.]